MDTGRATERFARGTVLGGCLALVVGAIGFLDGLNRYLGNFIGEFLGELSFSLFFVLSGVGLLRRAETRRWLGWTSIVVGSLGMVGMWRNVTPVVAPVAEVNNYLLPLWMLVFGGWLVWLARSTSRTRWSRRRFR